MSFTDNAFGLVYGVHSALFGRTCGKRAIKRVVLEILLPFILIADQLRIDIQP